MLYDSPDDKSLDNPVWYSLLEKHRHFGFDHNHIKFYHPDYCPFGGYQPGENISGYMEEYSALVRNFFIVGNKPELPDGLQLKNELVCLQMISRARAGIEIKENIVKLTAEHVNALFQLVDLVQPGYFKRKTALLGDYFGIFEKNKLIAVTGERMSMNGFTEVSAVVTHPAHTGKGYAQQLVAHTVNAIFNQHEIPFLHVLETNTSAIGLYKKLGFETRRKISFWQVTKNH